MCVRLVLKVVMQNDGDFVDVILLFQNILKLIYNFYNCIFLNYFLTFVCTKLKNHSMIFLPATSPCPLHLSKILTHK
jgi:hypothetical protein